MTPKDDPKKLVGEVQVFRIRVATAESKLELLRDQARQAKRRRKEAKRSAQRARKQFKRSKAELAELQEALAKAEVKLFQAGGRALARKTAKAVARKSRPAVTRKSRVSRRATRKKPAIAEPKVVSGGPAEVAALDPTPSTTPTPGSNS